MKKAFFTYTAAVEALTGLGLLFIPSRVAFILFGTELTDPVGTVFAMVAGAGICSIALLSRLSRKNLTLGTSIPVLLFYNIIVSVVLFYAALGLGYKGIPVWIVMIFHLYQTVISLVLLKKAKEV